jgi:hypothetical protein
LASEGFLFPYLSRVRAGDRATEFKQRCLGLGIEGVSLHSYRYAWAERAKACGYPERFAQEALGHNWDVKPEATEDDYVVGQWDGGTHTGSALKCFFEGALWCPSSLHYRLTRSGGTKLNPFQHHSQCLGKSEDFSEKSED